MDRTTVFELMNTLVRFKKIGASLLGTSDLHMGELFVLNHLAQSHSSEEPACFATDIHQELHVTKPAISQMLNSLEKKGYLCREIDPNDRRRFTLSLTMAGRAVALQMNKQLDGLSGEVVSRFGEENMRNLIDLFTQFADISESVTLASPDKS